jgi:cytochrome c-type biogenesis protein CcmH/NrfG
VSVVRSIVLALLLLSAAAAPREAPLHCAGQASASANRDYERCRAHVSLDACNDAIRRNPSDPVLLVARGDALVRAGRAADALRAYQRAAALAPNTRGVDAKISATEAKLSAMRATRTPAAKSAGSQKGSSNRYSNAAAETQSH